MQQGYALSEENTPKMAGFSNLKKTRIGHRQANCIFRPAANKEAH
jgi:hypothetical protein